MTKKWTALLLAAVLAVGLSACDTSRAEAPGSNLESGVSAIEDDDIAVMGFSAGGIQAGEFLMHYDEDVNGTALDESYVPDALDAVPAHASAAGMIYSFYGRLRWATWTRTGWPRVICRQHSTFTARRTPSTANSSSSMM